MDKPQIKRIMVGLGLGEYSQGIFNYATLLATAMQVDLLLVNVINERDIEAIGSVVSMGYEVDGEHYVQEVKKERQQKIKQIIANSGFPKDKVGVVIKVGHPYTELVRIVVRENIDTLVIGTKGRSNLEHALVGSTAEKLFRRCPASIVCYKAPELVQKLEKKFK